MNAVRTIASQSAKNVKSTYFTPENIHTKSREILQELRSFRKARNLDFDPGRAALFILDMQNYFLDETSHAHIPSALAILPRISKLADVFQKADLPVILTRHTNSAENARLMARWWRELISEKSAASQIHPDLDLPDAVVVPKTQYDGFYQTPLEEILKQKRIQQLVITGVMTHLCCETTARSAFVRGFAIFLPVDGTATVNEAFHRASLLNLSHGFGTPVLVQEIQTAVEAFSRGR